MPSAINELTLGKEGISGKSAQAPQYSFINFYQNYTGIIIFTTVFVKRFIDTVEIAVCQKRGGVLQISHLRCVLYYVVSLFLKDEVQIFMILVSSVDVTQLFS